MMRTLPVILGLAALSLAATVMLRGQNDMDTHQAMKMPPPVEISIDNFSFSPATVTIPAGTKVTWINGDDVPHSVVSGDKLFKGPALDTDEKFSYTFAKPGTYAYYCSLHPMMTAKIVVK